MALAGRVSDPFWSLTERKHQRPKPFVAAFTANSMSRSSSWARQLVPVLHRCILRKCPMDATLAGKTIFISGGSRGIELAIAMRAARDGANVAIAAKTAEPHPSLPGTIYTAARQIEDAGGHALPLVCDIRVEEQVDAAVAATVKQFGGIDICLNNASAVRLTGILDTPLKRYDMVNGVNARGTFLVTQKCLPHLLIAENPHILAISPPLHMEERWFAPHVAYSIAKFGIKYRDARRRRRISRTRCSQRSLAANGHRHGCDVGVQGASRYRPIALTGNHGRCRPSNPYVRCKDRDR